MIGAMVLFVFVNVMRIRRMPPKMGMNRSSGSIATARSAIDPRGFVYMNGEYWAAESEEDAIPAGEKVIITQVNGLKLKVRRLATEGEPT